jgi:hypothetical protein
VKKKESNLTPLEKPFSYEQLVKLTSNGTDHVVAVVAVDLGDLVCGDIDLLNNVASEQITGNECGLMDLSFELVGVCPESSHGGSFSGKAFIRVTALANLDYLCEFTDAA